MPREPRCGQNRSDARKADEATPAAVCRGGLTPQMGGFRRNPQGRRIFCRMPSLLGLDDPLQGRRRPHALACVKTCGVAATGHSVRDSKLDFCHLQHQKQRQSPIKPRFRDFLNTAESSWLFKNSARCFAGHLFFSTFCVVKTAKVELSKADGATFLAVPITT